MAHTLVFMGFIIVFMMLTALIILFSMSIAAEDEGRGSSVIASGWISKKLT
ncbi:hypothetical protein [Photobacterium gaetbulicola]|uniref:hypothetical protein n=1 Tax=Photobacterium gaetbulicola TaxID=1295392 RepID=UPI0012E03574|nr:hypothetical protein [Photobacterium gaetbulicola]